MIAKVGLETTLVEPQKQTTVKRTITPEERRKMIAERAYFNAEKRRFAPGQEEQDWLEAEKKVNALVGDYWLP